ncbi:hypothetical protein FIBSPDRAFT_1055851 [Athelia psychrophila]|uniref:STE3-domain-containing protein n=1 Tax=Athelia psychrophila TaxID=1759441 RepID=A0A167T1T0_9AGAM|nr:hypothetical protein FIBSPDRAFT_1055851 [Fibularhizoctonia sp. CBS 109695]
MLKHSVKLTWVILCSIGLIFSWPILWALAKVTGCWWIPVAYGTALTTMVLSFDLGLIWRLNPYEFPIGFCLTQMTIVTLSASILTGVSTAWYYAALSAAVWPAENKRALRWRPSFIPVVIVIPIASTILQMAFTIRHKAYVQTGYDGTLCDVTEPLWPKLFGYGAAPLLYITPCIIFTLFSIHRLQRTMKAHQMLWKDMANQVRFERPAIPPPPARCRNYAGLGQSSPGSDNVYFESSHNLVALRKPRLDDLESSSSPKHLQSTPNSIISSTDDIRDLSGSENDTSTVCVGDQPASHPTVDVVSGSPVDNDTSFAECDLSSYGGVPVPAFPNLPPKPSLSLFPQIWRLQLFLLSFGIMCLLLTLPTLVSLTQHRGPRQFGTDHIAGILASWSVVGIFGHSPAVHLVLFGRRIVQQDRVLPFS